MSSFVKTKASYFSLDDDTDTSTLDNAAVKAVRSRH